MTQDEIIEMARQAGAATGKPTPNGPDIIFPQCLDTYVFAKLVAAKVRKLTLEEMIYSHPTTAIKQAVEYEREVCAKICIDLAADYISKGHPASEIAARALAIGVTQIQARGEA